jgi:hypothetical protein
LRGDSGSTGVDGGVMRVCSGSDDFAGPRADAGIDLGAPTFSKSHLRIKMVPLFFLSIACELELHATRRSEQNYAWRILFMRRKHAN